MKLEQVHPKIIQVEHLQGFYKKNTNYNEVQVAAYTWIKRASLI